jgi:hypothetical protein
MTNVTQTAAATFGGAAVGKVLGRLACGGDMHFTPDERAPYGPPVTLEIKIGDDVALSVTITGFDLQRQQQGASGTRVLLLANEVS